MPHGSIETLHVYIYAFVVFFWEEEFIKENGDGCLLGVNQHKTNFKIVF